MKKIISLTLVMVMLLFVLTGCVKVDYEVQLNKNGSADVAFIYAFEKEALEQMGAKPEDATKEMESQSEKNGFKLESFTDDKYVGFKASKHIDKAEDVSLQEAFGEGYVKDSENNKIKVEKNGSKTVYSQNAEIDLSGLNGMEKAITMKYTVKLPVKAKTNNAQEVSKDGKTLTWNLKAGEVTKVEFTASSGGINTTVIVIAVVAVLVVAGIICVVAKGSKKETAETKTEKEEEKSVTEEIKEEEPVAEETVVEEAKNETEEEVEVEEEEPKAEEPETEKKDEE